jgi:hypothetical protein
MYANLQGNKMTIGKLKFVYERWKNYVAGANFLMIVYMFVRDSGISWWWVALGFFASACFMWIDLRFIAPSEYEYSSRINPQWVELMENTKK